MSRISPPARLVVANSTSAYGDWLTALALPVALLGQSGSTSAPAAYVLARFAPRLVGPLGGGLATGRVGPRRVILWCLAAQTVAAGAIAAILGLGHSWAALPFVVASQVAGSAVRPSVEAMVRGVSPADQLQQVNARLRIGSETALLIAPAVGALALHVVGAWVLVLVDAASFAVAAAVIATLPSGWVHNTEAASRPRRTGVRHVWTSLAGQLARRDIRVGSAVYLAGGILSASSLACFVLASADRFGGAANSGYLFAAGGIGGILAGVLAARVRLQFKSVRPILAASLVEIAAMAAFVLVRPMWAAAALVVVYSAASIFGATLLVTLIQLRRTVAQVGAAMGMLITTLNIGLLVGALLALALAPRIGWADTLLAASALAAVCVLGILAVPVAVEPAVTGIATTTVPRG